MIDINAIITNTLGALQTTPATVQATPICLPLSEEAICRLLATAYQSEVSGKGGSYLETGMATNAIRTSAKWLKGETGLQWLLYSGGSGLGKTTLANAMRAMIIELRRQLNDAEPKYWASTEEEKAVQREFTRAERAAVVPYKRTAAEIFSSYQQRNWEEYRKAGTERFVIIDDLGKEPARLYSSETPLAEIICKRYDYRLPTLITTNLPIKMLAKQYGQHVADRISELCMPITFEE